NDGSGIRELIWSRSLSLVAESLLAHARFHESTMPDNARRYSWRTSSIALELLTDANSRYSRAAKANSPALKSLRQARMARSDVSSNLLTVRSAYCAAKSCLGSSVNAARNFCRASVI